MTLLELVTDLRKLLEDTGGHNVDWESSSNSHLLKWDNDELTSFINEAEREVAKRTHCLFDSNRAEVCKITVNVGQSSYNLNPKIIKIRRAKLTNKTSSLRQVSWRDLEALSSTWEDKTGEPDYFLLDWDYGKLVLNPVPTTADTMWLSVYRYPIEDLLWDQRDVMEPEIPEEYHRKMLHWAAHLAYEKDEPNTLDPQRSGYHMKKFENDFGMAESQYAVERKKRTPRQIKYGGI